MSGARRGFQAKRLDLVDAVLAYMVDHPNDKVTSTPVNIEAKREIGDAGLEWRRRPEQSKDTVGHREQRSTTGDAKPLREPGPGQGTCRSRYR